MGHIRLLALEDTTRERERERDFPFFHRQSKQAPKQRATVGPRGIRMEIMGRLPPLFLSFSRSPPCFSCLVSAAMIGCKSSMLRMRERKREPFLLGVQSLVKAETIFVRRPHICGISYSNVHVQTEHGHGEGLVGCRDCTRVRHVELKGPQSTIAEAVSTK